MTRNEQRLAVALGASLLACAAMAASLNESQRKVHAAEAAALPVVAQVALAFDPSLPTASEAFAAHQPSAAEAAPTF